MLAPGRIRSRVRSSSSLDPGVAPMRRKLSSLGPARLLVLLVGLLLFNSLYLAVSNRLPDPPRLFISATFYMGNVALHLLLGLAALLVVIWAGRHWRRAIHETVGP